MDTPKVRMTGGLAAPMDEEIDRPEYPAWKDMLEVVDFMMQLESARVGESAALERVAELEEQMHCKDCDMTHDTTNPHCGRSYRVHGPLTPHTCPVCNGAQTVSEGFYTQNMEGIWSGSGAGGRETCRSCSGTGVVWG